MERFTGNMEQRNWENYNDVEAEAEAETNMYDLNEYTDAEIISEILDLDDPSSRVLETKIVGLIRKYRNEQLPEIEQFFTDVYSRLFGLEQAEDGSLVVVENGPSDEDGSSSPFSLLPPAKGRTVERFDGRQTLPPVTQTAVSNVQVNEYSKGVVNPLLKETCHRLIDINSQYRASTYPYSTDFTLNFSEVIKNVVKMHLYSITIPYQWYTISRAYGSNFFVIRGASPGIDTGNHDITVQINPGTYTPQELIETISGSLNDLKTTYPEMTFGNTGIGYDKFSATASISLDIQNTYTTSFFSAAMNSDVVFTPPTSANRNNVLSAYLGFTRATYALSSANSMPLNLNTDSIFTIDNSPDNPKNQFTLYQYTPTLTLTASDLAAKGIPEYAANISGSPIPPSSILTTITFTIPPKKYTQATLVTTIDFLLKNNPKLMGIVSGLTYDTDNGVFVLSAGLSRSTPNVPYSALAFEFPNNTDWTGNTGIYFSPINAVGTTTIVELNNLQAETELTSSDFTVNSDTYIEYICNAKTVDIDPVHADIVRSAAGYSQDGFMLAIQTGVNALNLGPNNVAQIDASDSKFKLSVDINTVYDSTNYTMSSGSGQYLYTALGISGLSGQSLTDGIQFSGEFDYQSGNNGYTVPSKTVLCTIGTSATGTSSNVNLELQEVTFPETPAGTAEWKYSLDGLMTAITDIFSNFRDVVDNQRILQKTIISYKIKEGGNNKVSIDLFVTVNRVVTENEYTIKFVDTNSTTTVPSIWASSLYLTSTYDLSGSNVLTVDGVYKQIVGTQPIASDKLILNADTPLYLVPDERIDGIAGSGTPTIIVPRNTDGYTRQSLFATINNLFATNEQTLGSHIEYVTDNLNREFTKIRWSVHKTYKTSDYSLVFYDTDRFVSCFIGNSSTRNVRPDETLGWILGYKAQTEYFMASNITTLGGDGNTYYGDTANRYTYDAATNAATIWGDSTVNVNIYNSFFVIINDYNQNRLTDSIVAIAAPDYQMSLPSYASRYAATCDPVSNQKQSIGIRAGAQSSLTRNQIYAASQIIDAQNARTTAANQPGGVYLTDVFAAVPLKLGSTAFGQNHTELSGTLQNQDRIYFGPVNINRMSIQLVNDKGDPVDLNGQNWSMQLSCEYLYKNV